ncbi:tRNA (guanine) methyltransferase [Sporobolomyces salmoneus]|uniref:tRNA (guanine) methyltransferase n=1 Tax=Sporobolomyces salmoneus TaxID=183962 RepID=UPI00316F6F0A
MTSSNALPQPTIEPPVNRGMEQLDRSKFTQTLNLLAARLPAARTTQFLKQDAKDFVLRMRGIGAVTQDPSGDYRRVLLRTGDKARFPPKLVEVLKQHEAELVEESVSFDYDYWTSDQVLQAILPEDLLDESPTAFTQVGHIAHLNLRDQYLPHKFLIGQVILDKNKSLRTVVNKLDSIDNVYRNFQMEVLAGEPDFIVEMSEHDCRFKFDFSKVYWNSRLQTEHARLVDSFDPQDVVCDAFAGVGPFAIPAGKKGCGVMASDLNPASAEALTENAKLNKVESTVRTGNEDARNFIRSSVLAVWETPFPTYVPPLSNKERNRRNREARGLVSSSTAPTPPTTSEPSAPQPPRRLINHFVMNLPASAIEFLDAYRGLYRELYERHGDEAREEVKRVGLPIVHCYCFTKDIEGAEKDICERATRALGFEVHPQLSDYNLRFVRDVAPKKEMYCLEFRLTDEMIQ